VPITATANGGKWAWGSDPDLSATLRPGHRAPTQASAPAYMFPAMFWPLIGGLIAFVLFALLMGWIMDKPSRDAGRGGSGGRH
jgi:di/tricarboxylate transporter